MYADRDMTFWPYVESYAAHWHGIARHDEFPETWLWLPAERLRFEQDLETLDHLIVAGWERMEPESRMINASGQYLRMFSQLRDVRLVGPRDDFGEQSELWARAEDISQCNALPVTLAFTLHDLADRSDIVATESLMLLWMGQLLPPPHFGEVGLVAAENNGEPIWQRYTFEQLDDNGRDLLQRLSCALVGLAGGDERLCWPTSSDYHRDATTNGPTYQAIRAAAERAKGNPEEWIRQWGEIQSMAQQLAAAYWKAHKSAQPSSRIPVITSAHRTRLPSANAWRALAQGFGPVMMPSLWDTLEADSDEASSRVLVLETPNGSQMRLRGRTEHETAALQHYIWTMLGPEGLKHTIGLIDAYHAMTGGRDQKTDARVTPRGLLEHIGAANPDDPEDQRKLMHTILYLSRCGIVAAEKIDDPEAYRRRTGRRKAPKETKTWTPLLVIEGFEFIDGNLKTLEAIDFHLGREFYSALFGESQTFFTIPTAVVFGYHAQKQQHELLLSVYLSNMIVMNAGRGPFSCYFPTLLEQTALASEQQMERGAQRLRGATQVLRAMEQLETDSLVIREPNRDIDAVHTVDLVMGHVREQELAAATLARIKRSADYRMWCKQRDEGKLPELTLKGRRRQALQRLLQGQSAGTAAKITFKAGLLLEEQARKREAGRKVAQERDERAKEARITQNVLAGVSRQLGIDAPKPGGKRRGRPPKRAK